MKKTPMEKRKSKELIDKWLEDADVSSVDTESQISENREDDAEEEKKRCAWSKYFPDYVDRLLRILSRRWR